MSELFGGGFSAWVDRGMGDGQEINILMVRVAWVRVVLQRELRMCPNTVLRERRRDCGIGCSCWIKSVVRLRYQKTAAFCGELRTLHRRILCPISVLVPGLFGGCGGGSPVRRVISPIRIPVRIVIVFLRCRGASPNNQDRWCRHHHLS